MTLIAIRAFLASVPRWLWGLLAAVALLGGVWLHGYHRADSGWEARWDAQQAVYAAERKAAEEAARKTEERHRAEYKAIAGRFLALQEKADEEHAAVVAGLRAGTVRVRQRLTCPRVPDTAGSAQGTDGAGPRGLSPADAELLLRVGRDADEIARRLNALQEAVRAGQR